jgi:predicted DNA-binding transcriptional regulator AlpA
MPKSNLEEKTEFELVTQYSKPFMNSKEFVELTGIALSTVYSYIHYDQIPKTIYRKVGRNLIFIRPAVIQWILDGAEIGKRSSKVA